MDGGDRTFVAGIHCLEHVERLARSDFANDDAIRPHAQRVSDKVTLIDLIFSLDVGGPCFEADDVCLFWGL